MLSRSQQKLLLTIARTSVKVFLLEKKVSDFDIYDQLLSKMNGAFVTIKALDGVLRGCVGIIENNKKPLYKLVVDMAINAATQDNRFVALKLDELDKVCFEISVLSKPQKIKRWQDIKLSKQGVVIEKDGQSGVFLPQVAKETGWELEEFLEKLCAEKAGLPANTYQTDENIILKVFEAQVFSE